MYVRTSSHDWDGCVDISGQNAGLPRFDRSSIPLSPLLYTRSPCELLKHFSILEAKSAGPCRQTNSAPDYNRECTEAPLRLPPLASLVTKIYRPFEPDIGSLSGREIILRRFRTSRHRFLCWRVIDSSATQIICIDLSSSIVSADTFGGIRASSVGERLLVIEWESSRIEFSIISRSDTQRCLAAPASSLEKNYPWRRRWPDISSNERNMQRRLR